MRSFVVGVDGSEPSIRALKYAAALAEELRDAELIVVYARYLPFFWAPDSVAENEFSDVLDQAEQYVREVAEGQLSRRNLKWSIEEREGEPVHVLCEIAHEVDADFVVVGRQGRSMAAELLLGSVSNRLVHRSDVRVLLVP